MLSHLMTNRPITAVPISALKHIKASSETALLGRF